MSRPLAPPRALRRDYARRVHEPTAPHPWHVLVVTGGLGAGKTSVAVEVGEVLDARGEPVSVVDLDQLCWTSPAGSSSLTVDDVLHGSLAALLPVHAAAGVHRLVLPRLLRTAAQVGALREVIGPASMLVVELTATAEARTERLRRRDSGAVLDGHLTEVGTLLPDDGAADVRLATDGLAVRDVALEVVRLWDAAT